MPSITIKISVTVTVLVLLSALYLNSSSNTSNSNFKKIYVQRPLVCTATGNRTREDEANILAIFAGRWKFLRIYLPYIYRELRVNGGVLDKVVFMMIKYDKYTHNHLVNFTEVANSHLKSKVFEFNFLGYSLYDAPPVFQE